MSPKRTRSHVLEDISKGRFPQSLPEAWVVREIPRDYGIDLEVEVFSEEEATGITFRVQLKSTDSPSKGRPTRIVKLDHLAYWNSLGVPVMIALYVEPEDTFYWCWSSSHDPGPSTRNKKSTTIHFATTDVLAPTSGDRIVSEIRILRRLMAHDVTRPISVRVTSSAIGISSGQIMSEFRGWIGDQNLTNLVRAVSGETLWNFEIHLGDDAIRASAPLNTASITLHGSRLFERVSPECCALLSALLATGGFWRESAALFRASHDKSRIWHSPSLLLPIITMMTHGGEFELAVAAARSLWDAFGPTHSEQVAILLSGPALSSAELSDSLAQEVAELWIDLSTEALKANQLDRAGAALFNAAGALKKYHPVEAGNFLAWAEQLKPQYSSDARFFHLRAGCWFRAGAPALAAADYARAMAIDPNQRAELTPEYGDSLLFAGKYRECTDLLSGAKTSSHRLDRLAIVDLLTANALIEITGLEDQDRDLETQFQSDRDDPTWFLKTIDACNAAAWNRLLTTTTKPSLRLLVANARFQCTDVQAWVSAATAAYREDAPKVTRRAILQQGLIDGGPDFLARAQHASNEMPADANLLVDELESEAQLIEEYRPGPWSF